MQIPLQIAFRNMAHSDAIASQIRKRAAHLEKFYRRIMSCRIVVDQPHRHHIAGNHLLIRIDLKLPGKEIAINRDPPLHNQARDFKVAIRDAFASAERAIQDYIDVRRRHTKHPSRPPHGWVSRLFKNEGCGFITTQDGDEIYFHQNSVLNYGFDDLELGAEVRFNEEDGREGPQATTIELVGKDGRHIPHLI